MTEPYRPLRVLVVGDPGSGKTAAIGSLLRHGQNLYIGDFDKNVEPILQLVPEGQRTGRLEHVDLVDPLAFDANLSPIPIGRPRAFRTFVEKLQEWKVQEFGKDDWLVVDTLTSMGPAIFRQVLKDHKRFGKEPRIRVRQKDWGVAIDRMEQLLDFFKQLNCNVIATAHLMRLSNPIDDEEEEEEEKGQRTRKPARKVRMTAALAEALTRRYPATLGQKLPPKIAGQFNVALQAKRMGYGTAARYVIRTKPDDDVDLKCPAIGVPAEVEGKDLFSIFKRLRPELGPATGRVIRNLNEGEQR